MTSTDVSPSDDDLHATPLQAISNAMAQIYKRQLGRGPTRIRTHFAGPDIVVCVLEDTQTPAEHRMVELGEHQRLRDVRLCVQDASEEEIKQPVELATGRRVRAYISGIDTSADVCSEIFVLDGEVVPATGPPGPPSGAVGS